MARDLAITLAALCVLGVSAWATASVGAYHADQDAQAVGPGATVGSPTVSGPVGTAGGAGFDSRNRTGAAVSGTANATRAMPPPTTTGSTVRAKPAERTTATNGTATPTPTPSQPPDYDGDGIPDASDRCPTRPETRNGYLDGDGCPDTVATSGAS